MLLQEWQALLLLLQQQLGWQQQQFSQRCVQILVQHAAQQQHQDSCRHHVQHYAVWHCRWNRQLVLVQLQSC
jgi:hypothetical protein